jgi:translation initiation factor 2-alpha kinase 4
MFCASYDNLLRDLSLPGARQVERSHVGATLAVSKLSQAMASRYSGATDKSKADADKVPRRCEIYVVSYSSGLIDARLVISRELWRNGLSADLVSIYVKKSKGSVLTYT